LDFPEKQFGLIVAYLLPGFIALGGIALLVPSVASWMKVGGSAVGWEIAPPLYALLAALTAGMIVSCFRWLIIDQVFAVTGIRSTAWDPERMGERFNAFNLLVEWHYRYYQFYANSVVAIVWTYLLNRFVDTSPFLGPLSDVAVVILCGVLLAGARDALLKYYDRGNRLVGGPTP
jgi:hypothetical protein